jgi:hypothetical protein
LTKNSVSDDRISVAGRFFRIRDPLNFKMKLRVSKSQPCIGSLVAAEVSALPVEVSWVAGQTELEAGLGVILNTDANIAR